jgi:hypothetical protein
MTPVLGLLRFADSECIMPITFDQIEKLPNGAQFYTADLHVHSFGASHDVKDSGMTVEKIIDTARKHHISLLSITDHNNDSSVRPSIEYAQKYASNLLVLPGVEITTANGHLLVYFAQEKFDCVRNLLAQIEIQGKYGSRDSHTRKSMAEVIDVAERLGGICIAAHIDRAKTGFEAMIQGYPNAKKDIIASSGLYGLEFDSPSHLVWYSVDDESTPHGSERKKLLKIRLESKATSVRPRLAAVQNSDAHSISDFVAQHTRRFLTRLKMSELTFEGFRTALIDPEARVRAVSSIPPAIPRVLGMQIDGGFLDGNTFHFSDNLNCFIGGRGTGKSTAIKSLAYGLGLTDELEDYDNCPDNVVLYCEDENGVRFRYERNRGQAPDVQAKEDRSITDVPSDAFRVEFYGQGQLAEVAHDPLNNSSVLQQFLDTHISLNDLKERESAQLSELSENSSQLIPLEASAAQLGTKLIASQEIEKKLKIAEAGRLKEIVTLQSKLASEKALCSALIDIQQFYSRGVSFSNLLRSYDNLAIEAGELTGHPDSTPFLQKAQQTIYTANASLQASQKAVTEDLKRFSKQLGEAITGLQAQHHKMEYEINSKVTEFQKKGLSGDIRGLNLLIKQKEELSAEILRIRGQQALLQELRDNRSGLLGSLQQTRLEMATRRKEQLFTINQNLRKTTEDYAVNLYYDSSGIVDDFKALLDSVMEGTYFQEESKTALCNAVTPEQLALLVRARDMKSIEKLGKISADAASKITEEFLYLSNSHILEVTAKPAKPIIKVMTKGSRPRELNVNQLSDGQKHTILLTVAMLAESNLPLVMDQPEDDLDNAFIFNCVVSTLRSIKERRQIILVTHNANIAVLGDSEMLFPMQRKEYRGTVIDPGSIDRDETKQAVQNILEGGEQAFRRRQEIYGH